GPATGGRDEPRQPRGGRAADAGAHTASGTARDPRGRGAPRAASAAAPGRRPARAVGAAVRGVGGVPGVGADRAALGGAAVGDDSTPDGLVTRRSVPGPATCRGPAGGPPAGRPRSRCRPTGAPGRRGPRGRSPPRT